MDKCKAGCNGTGYLFNDKSAPCPWCSEGKRRKHDAINQILFADDVECGACHVNMAVAVLYNCATYQRGHMLYPLCSDCLKEHRRENKTSEFFTREDGVMLAYWPRPLTMAEYLTVKATPSLSLVELIERANSADAIAVGTGQ